MRYNHSISLRVNGHDYLQAVYDKPKLLRRALNLLRIKNPNRVYVSTDPNIQ